MDNTIKYLHDISKELQYLNFNIRTLTQVIKDYGNIDISQEITIKEDNDENKL